MSSIKLKLNQYHELLNKQFGNRYRREELTILTYLFYKVKSNDDLDTFKNIDDADIGDYFRDYEFKRCYEEETKDINQDVLLFSSIIKHTDLEVFKEFLNNRIKNYFISLNRYKDKKSVEDLLENILDLNDGDELLYCFENSFKLLNAILQNKNIKTTIYIFNNERLYKNYDSNYVYLKMFLAINANEVDVIYKKKIEKEFDKIFIDPLPISTMNEVNGIVRQNLKVNGLAIKLLQDNLLDTNDEDLKMEREKDLNDKILKSVIAIPKSINSYGSNILTNSSIIVYSKDKKYENCIFVDASNECERDEKNSWFTNKNIENIVAASNNESNTMSKLISYETIRDNGISLLPFNYIKNDGNLKNAIELEKIAKVFRGNDLVRIRRSANELELLSGKYQYKSLAATYLDDESIDYSNLPIVNIDKNIDGFVILPGDILINRNGTRIRTYLYECNDINDIIPDGNIIVIRPCKEKINSVYLKTYLDSDEGNKALLNIAQSGTIIRSINVGRINKISVPCPSIEDQEEFAKKYLEKKELISKVNNEIKDLCSSYFHK